VWESAAFSSIFLASSFSTSQALSTPAHIRVTQTAPSDHKSTLTTNKKVLIHQARWTTESKMISLHQSYWFGYLEKD
jgi:hypothetical protein